VEERRKKKRRKKRADTTSVTSFENERKEKPPAKLYDKMARSFILDRANLRFAVEFLPAAARLGLSGINAAHRRKKGRGKGKGWEEKRGSLGGALSWVSKGIANRKLVNLIFGSENYKRRLRSQRRKSRRP